MMSQSVKLLLCALAVTHASLRGFPGDRRLVAQLCETGTRAKRSTTDLATFVGETFDTIAKDKLTSCPTSILTKASLKEAIESGKFDMFANGGKSDDMDKREIAAFLANVYQETGELCKTVESSCDGSSPAPKCDDYQKVFWPKNSKDADSSTKYYGRGALQLLYPGNYRDFLNFWNRKTDTVYTLVKGDVEKVGTDGKVAWASALWFWTRAQSPKPSCTEVMQCDSTNVGCKSANECPKNPEGAVFGFGWTINIINGARECGIGVKSAEAVNRAKFFAETQEAAGLTGLIDHFTSCARMDHY